MAIFTFDGVESVDSGIVDTRIRLAPDLNYLSNNAAPETAYKVVTINAVGGLTTAISLTGKYAIAALGFNEMTSGETATVKLTIDGVVIINDTFTLSTTGLSILNCGASTFSAGRPVYTSGTSLTYKDISMIQCESSLLLEIQVSADTSINCNYIARPIL